jgi:hypothetical protein
LCHECLCCHRCAPASVGEPLNEAQLMSTLQWPDLTQEGELDALSHSNSQSLFPCCDWHLLGAPAACNCDCSHLSYQPGAAPDTLAFCRTEVRPPRIMSKEEVHCAGGQLRSTVCAKLSLCVSAGRSAELPGCCRTGLIRLSKQAPGPTDSLSACCNCAPASNDRTPGVGEKRASGADITCL